MALVNQVFSGIPYHFPIVPMQKITLEWIGIQTGLPLSGLT